MWSFNIQPKAGAAPLNVDAFSEGFSSHPLSFETDIKPRGPYVEEVIKLNLEQFEPTLTK